MIDDIGCSSGSDKVSIDEFSDQVFLLEGIRLIIRSSGDEMVLPYAYSEEAIDSWSLDEFVECRIRGLIGGLPFEIVKPVVGFVQEGDRVGDVRFPRKR